MGCQPEARVLSRVGCRRSLSMASTGMRSTPAPKVSLGTKRLVGCEVSTSMVCPAEERASARIQDKEWNTTQGFCIAKLPLLLKRLNKGVYETNEGRQAQSGVKILTGRGTPAPLPAGTRAQRGRASR